MATFRLVLLEFSLIQSDFGETGQISIENGHPLEFGDSDQMSLDSDRNFQILVVATKFRQSNIKIRGSSTVDSGYQQTLMPGADEFPRMCV